MPRMISNIYTSAPKIGGKVPVLGTPSDEPKKTRKSSIVARNVDVYTSNGVLYNRNVHKGQFGTFIMVQKHEIKVYCMGKNAWVQKGLDINNIKLSPHPIELADNGLTNKPIRIYGDYAHTCNMRHTYHQRNLKCEQIHLTPAQYLEMGQVVSSRDKILASLG